MIRLATAVILASSLAGCETPPQGSSGGRIDPYRSTAADERSPYASMPALLEFSDQAAASLAQDITAIPEIRDSPSRVVIELGGLNNQTGTPTGDFELIQHRLYGRLFESDVIRRHAVLTEDPHRMDRELERLEATGADGRSARYSAQATYVLLGDFFEAQRDNVRRYYFEFKLVNLAERNKVHAYRYDLGQVGG